MKWYKRNVNLLSRKERDTRVVSVYLLVPKNIDGEVRWLEHAYIKQIVVRKSNPYGRDCFLWCDVKWTTKEDEFIERL